LEFQAPGVKAGLAILVAGLLSACPDAGQCFTTTSPVNSIIELGVVGAELTFRLDQPEPNAA